MSPIALYVLAGIVAPMAGDRVARPESYCQKPVRAISMPLATNSDYDEVRRESVERRKKFLERRNEWVALHDRLQAIDVTPAGPDRDCRMEQWGKDFQQYCKKWHK